MRIVHLSTSDVGGAAIAAINLHRALLEAGMHSDLLTLRKTRDDVPRHALVDPFALGGPRPWNWIRFKARRALEKAGLVEDRNNQPVNRHLQGRPAGREIFTLPYSWFDILDHPLVRQADLIHLHWVSYGMIDVERFFTRCSTPVVWTMHDMNPFTGGCHHADECTGYRDACAACPQLADHSRAQAWWSAKQRGLAAIPTDRLQVVAPSAWLAGRAQGSSLMRGRHVSIIPNGFDTNVFRPMDRAEARRRLGLPADARIVLFNAFDADSPRKGMPLLVPALESMGGQAMLLCLGGATVSDRLPGARYSGHLSDPAQVALHYNAADVFVLPSQAENLPNTICEAHLCGTPVVAFDVGGIPEQVDATNGVLVGERTPHALHQALEQALSTTYDRDRMARTAAARYDQRRVAEAYRALYSQWSA